MTDHPIDDVVDFSGLPDYIKTYAVLVAEDADWVRARDLSDTLCIAISGDFYYLDPADTTSADDDLNVIVDSAGNRFKLDLGASDNDLQVADADLTITNAHRVIELSVAFTAPRTFTLPLAADVPLGRRIEIFDGVDAVDDTNTLTVEAQAGETINGSTDPAVFITPGFFVELISNGVDGWRYDRRNLDRSGDEMLGPLILYDDPTDPLEAATKQYVDNAAIEAARTNIGDTDYAMLVSDRVVALDEPITSPRTWTLPSAAGVTGGYRILVIDEVGGIVNAGDLLIEPDGSDSINGSTDPVEMAGPFAQLEFISNGVDAWSYDSGRLPSPYIHELQDDADAYEARQTLGIDQRTTVGDADYTILPTDRTVALTTTFTAARTLTLPAAADVNEGQELRIVDEAGVCNDTYPLTIEAAGSDTLSNGTSRTMAVAFSSVVLTSNGVDAWTYDFLDIESGGTGAGTAAGARVKLGVDVRTPVGNSNYAILATDRVVALTATLTTQRTWTLPAAADINPGQPIRVVDEVGGISNANSLVIQRAGSDTVNGGASITLRTAYTQAEFVSDGVSKWSVNTLAINADQFVSHGNAAASIASSERYAALTAALTAPRTWTLPAANSFQPGDELTVLDIVGGISATNTLTLARAGSDTIDGATSLVLSAAYSVVRLISDGVSTWTYSVGVGANTVQDTNLRQSAGLSVIGRSANTTGNVADITAASDGEVLRRSGTAVGFGKVATAGISDDAVTNALMANMVQATIKGRASGAGTGDPTDLTEVQARTILLLNYGATALADDTATSFSAPSTESSGVWLLTINGNPGANAPTLLIASRFFGAVTAPVVQSGDTTNVATTTGALSGTTGTDTKLNLSCNNDRKLYVENRMGGSKTINVALLLHTSA